MAISAGEQGAMIELMHAKYHQILQVESAWGIRLHEGDMRPRIEHFHDAVRALTSGTADLYAKNSRLSVEHLAYDLSQLRQVSDKPVGLINRMTEKSIGTALVRQNEAGASVPKMPPQGVRSEITALYRDYTVFFAALFAPVADMGLTYLGSAIVLGAVFLFQTVRLFVDPSPARAMRVFGWSITYVTLLFGAMAIDQLLPT